MSIYATDGENQIQVASNRGWGDVCRLAETLDDSPALTALCEYGIIEPAASVAGDCNDLLEAGGLEPSIATTLKRLANFAGFLKDGPLLITQGFGPNDATVGDESFSSTIDDSAS